MRAFPTLPLRQKRAKMIVFDLTTNCAESLLHHARTYQPDSGDCRDDSRLRDALDDLVEALEKHLKGESD